MVTGLANDYSGYITTLEEYGLQRYEGSHTLFGPHTLGAWQTALAGALKFMDQESEIKHEWGMVLGPKSEPVPRDQLLKERRLGRLKLKNFYKIVSSQESEQILMD